MFPHLLLLLLLLLHIDQLLLLLLARFHRMISPLGLSHHLHHLSNYGLPEVASVPAQGFEPPHPEPVAVHGVLKMQKGDLGPGAGSRGSLVPTLFRGKDKEEVGGTRRAGHTSIGTGKAEGIGPD